MLRLSLLAAATAAATATATTPAAPPAAAPCTALSVNAAAPANVVEPYYAAWNIDPSRDRLFFATDWSDAQLRYLGSQIGNGRIRFGGTGADFLWYELGSAPACKPTIPAVYECLNESTWTDLHGFSDASNASFILGLNIHPANASSPPKGAWDATNAAALLNYAKAHGQRLFALELGNEQNTIMTAAEQAGAFAVLSSTLDGIYGAGADRPLLVGPDTHSFRDAGSSDTAVLKYLGAFATAAGKHLHAITHHEYIEIDAKNVVNATFLDTSQNIARRVVAAVRAANSTLQVWAGEIGPHNGGTTPNPNCAGNKVCGRFGSAMWYADSMSAKALAGYSVYCRQDVIGADYALLNSSTHAPSPDYWLLALWTRLVGPIVLNTTLTPATSSVRAYSYCAAGGGHVTLVLINLAAAEECVALPSWGVANATQYTLTPGPGGVESATTLLNGAVLVLDGAGRLPALAGVSVAPGSVVLPPLSVSIVTVPLAPGAVPACA